MRIYRGDIGVEMSLTEFEMLLEDGGKLDDILDIINEVEMDQLMNLSNEELMLFEQGLYRELEEKSKVEQNNKDIESMGRILDFLNRYGKNI